MTGWKFPVPKDKDGDPTEARSAASCAAAELIRGQIALAFGS
jgi:hypothetical protein